MAHPIWKDYIATIAQPVTSAGFIIREVENSTVIYSGVAYARPGENAAKVRVNDICADWLQNTFPALVAGMSPAEVAALDLPMQFDIEDLNGNIVDSVEFYDDWSYDPTFDASTIGADPRWPLVDLGGEAICDYGTHLVNLSWTKDSDNHLPNTIQGTKATLVYGGLDGGDIRLIEPVPLTGGYGTGEGVDTLIPLPKVGIRFSGEVADFVRACQGDPEALETVAWCEQVTLDSVSVMQEIRAQMGVRYPDDER